MCKFRTHLLLQGGVVQSTISCTHNFMFPKFPLAFLCSIHAHAHMSWSQNSTQISTFPLLHTYHMLVCPSPKTPPKPVNFLCSTHAVCSHVLVPKFHPNQYISFFLYTCRMLACPGPKTLPKPLHFLCSIHVTCFHVMVPKLHPNQYTSCASYMLHSCMSWSQNFI